MKKIIENKVYDTATAKRLACAENGLMSSDLAYVCETLYQKKTGEFFLHGEGGGNSRYGEWHGNSGGPGEKIMPLPYQDARQWAEKNLDGNEYEQIFGNPESEDGRTDLHLSVSQNTKNALQRMSAERDGVSISSIIEELVSKCL